MKPIVKETIIKQIEVSDLDEIVDVQLFGKHPDGDCWDYDMVYDTSHVYWKNGAQIPIEMLLETIEKLKGEGATHVQIYSHFDHHGYYFTGVKLEMISKEDAKERKKLMLEKEIENQVKNVENRRNSVTESVDYLGKLYEQLEKINENKES